MSTMRWIEWFNLNPIRFSPLRINRCLMAGELVGYHIENSSAWYSGFKVGLTKVLTEVLPKLFLLRSSKKSWKLFSQIFIYFLLFFRRELLVWAALGYIAKSAQNAWGAAEKIGSLLLFAGTIGTAISSPMLRRTRILRIRREKKSFLLQKVGKNSS